MFLLPFVSVDAEGLSKAESQALSGSEAGLDFVAGVLK